MLMNQVAEVSDRFSIVGPVMPQKAQILHDFTMSNKRWNVLIRDCEFLAYSGYCEHTQYLNLT